MIDLDRDGEPLFERAGRVKAIRASIDDMRAGRIISAEIMLREMQQILAEMRSIDRTAFDPARGKRPDR